MGEVFTGDFPTLGGTLCALKAFVNFYEGSTERSRASGSARSA